MIDLLPQGPGGQCPPTWLCVSPFCYSPATVYRLAGSGGNGLPRQTPSMAAGGSWWCIEGIDKDMPPSGSIRLHPVLLSTSRASPVISIPKGTNELPAMELAN